MTDVRNNRIASASLLVALLFTLIIPLGVSGRIVAAILLLPAAVFIPLFIKKRSILSINKKQVLLVMTVIALLYVMAFYLSGLKFEFYKNSYGLSLQNFFEFFLPIAVIIIATEIVRFVFMAQNDRLTRVFCYFSTLLADMLICATIPSVTSFNRFMDLVAGTLLPAILSNLLYNYLAKRYGMYPNLVFRLLTTLHAYLFPITSGIEESLLNLVKLLLPIGIYLFIDALYEKKRRYALGNTSRAQRVVSTVLSILVLLAMIGNIMLVSNQFRYGSLVIATESMTGELNKGDVVIFERYEKQTIEEGQVIVFEKNDSLIVHRVADIQIINGITRYYTKGDANDDVDAGYITSASIVGVADYKLPFFGYPTLWMRSLFKR